MIRALAFAFLLGCTDGGGLDAGSACPAATPLRGSPCQPSSTNDIVCEYRPSDSCIMQAFCDINTFTWSVDGLPGCLPNPSVCPPALVDVPVGTTCSLPSAYVCAYIEGNCACEPCASDAGAQQVWRCNAWPSVCGVPRPLAGTACSSTATCDYSECCTPPALGPNLECVSGVWTVRPNTACKCATSSCP